MERGAAHQWQAQQGERLLQVRRVDARQHTHTTTRALETQASDLQDHPHRRVSMTVARVSFGRHSIEGGCKEPPAICHFISGLQTQYMATVTLALPPSRLTPLYSTTTREIARESSQ